MPESLTLPAPGEPCTYLSEDAASRLHFLRHLFITIASLNESCNQTIQIPVESLMASFYLFAEIMDVPMAEGRAMPDFVPTH